MKGDPRLLVWNYSEEEKRSLDQCLENVGAPHAVTIRTNQGFLTIREIIHTKNISDKKFECSEKVLLFYNIPSKGVHFLINAFKSKNLPRPIYAVVTEHSINWPFSELVDHLIEERETISKLSKKRQKEQKRKVEI